MTTFNHEEVSIVLRWLLRHPVEYESIKFIALTEADLEQPDPSATRRYVDAFLEASHLDHCSKCSVAIVLLPDSRALDYPTFNHHECHNEENELAPKPTEQAHKVRTIET